VVGVRWDAITAADASVQPMYHDIKISFRNFDSPLITWLTERFGVRATLGTMGAARPGTASAAAAAARPGAASPPHHPPADSAAPAAAVADSSWRRDAGAADDWGAGGSAAGAASACGGRAAAFTGVERTPLRVLQPLPGPSREGRDEVQRVCIFGVSWAFAGVSEVAQSESAVQKVFVSRCTSDFLGVQVRL
jgi:hypothetical protein